MNERQTEIELPRSGWITLLSVVLALLTGMGVRFYALPPFGSALGAAGTTIVAGLACLFLGYAAAYLLSRSRHNRELAILRLDYERLRQRSDRVLAEAEHLAIKH